MSQQFTGDLIEALKDVVDARAWQIIGKEDSLKEQRCTRLYGEMEADDLVLIYDMKKDKFHAMEAVCSHEGGPLELGDIEEIGGKRCIVCPWHYYEFGLEDGFSESSSLQQEIYPVMIHSGNIYIRVGENEVTLKPRSESPTLPALLTEELNPGSLKSESSLTSAAYQILTAEDPLEKIRLSKLFGGDWQKGKITSIGTVKPPAEPNRSHFSVVAPGKEKRRGNGGSLSSRISILHAMANIELWAIDLSWDIIARFVPRLLGTDDELPKEFIDDFVQIALEETKHFGMLNSRLNSLCSYFGAHPVHNGLWESALTTEGDLLARLAVVHMVHEARGLDIQPTQISKFERHEDAESVELLNVVYTEEIGHVSKGLKWFTFICKRYNKEPVEEFHRVVRANFRGYVKPPFNSAARRKAGMTPEWYEPLMKPKSTSALLRQDESPAGNTEESPT